ncbi:hypothetical protein WL51_11265 [Burkholderia ubonensis]|nr:hypothetical protein WJ74_13390 [Burkholderia ubonensis]KWC39370.1 hypothetical protein WL51_11265 [Burkholderia ubonensis]
MHGELTVESRVGEGSTFIASLPLPDAPPGWRGTFAEPDEVIGGATAFEPERHDDDAPRLRVLADEDHPASRALLSDQLDALGHDARLVTNGVEAMRAFFEHPFDGVLTDLGMPRDGRIRVGEFPARARGEDAGDRDDRARDRRRLSSLRTDGAAEVVLKPLSISALDAALRRQTVRGRAPAPARAVADGGAPAMSDSVRDALRDATLRSLAVIGNALASGDLQAIKVELHSTRGGFALAGDIAARDACAYAERAVTEGGAEAMRPARPGLEAAIGEALERLARRQ